MTDKAPVVHQSGMGSGVGYVERQVAERGWPMPNASMLGGKRRTKYHARRSRKHMSKQSVKRGGGCGCGLIGGKKRRMGRGKTGGFLGLLKEAIVPYGLFALQKRSQRKHRSTMSDNTKSKTYRKKYY